MNNNSSAIVHNITQKKFQKYFKNKILIAKFAPEKANAHTITI